jgi:hypothetical protein
MCTYVATTARAAGTYVQIDDYPWTRAVGTMGRPERL